MVNKTNYLSGLVSESLRSLQIMDPDTEFDEDGIPERSLYSAAKFVVSKLISDNEKKEYENLINQIILNLYDYLVSNKDDLSVFDDKDSMNNWKNLNVILNLMVKSNAVFMYERIGLKKREEIFSMLLVKTMKLMPRTYMGVLLSC